MPCPLILRNEKALSPLIGTVIALAIVVILAATIGAAVFGDGLGGSTKSGPMTNLEISEIDTHALKLEHLGGDPINFSKNLKIHFYHEGTDYELSYPDQMELLQAGDTKTLSISDIAELEPGDRATVTIVDEDSQSLIYKNIITFANEHQIGQGEYASIEDLEIELRKWVDDDESGLYIMFYNPTEKNFSFGEEASDSTCEITSSGYTFELRTTWLFDTLFKKDYSDDESYTHKDIYHFGRYKDEPNGGKGVEPNDDINDNEIQKIIEGKSSPIMVHIHIKGHDGIPEQDILKQYSAAVSYTHKPTDNNGNNGAYDHTCV